MNNTKKGTFPELKSNKSPDSGLPRFGRKTRGSTSFAFIGYTVL